MDTQPDGSAHKLSAGARVLLAVAVVLVIFGVVLMIEVSTEDKAPREGSELLAAPSPLIPESVGGGYVVKPEPDLARALESEYRRQSVAVTSVEAASLTLRGSAASLFAAQLDPSAQPASSEFRAGVLTGAAGGFSIDPAKNPFRAVFQNGLAIYTTSSEEGRLYVWFFTDAFIQLFVPAAIAGDAEEIRTVVVDAQVPSPSPSARALSPDASTLV